MTSPTSSWSLTSHLLASQEDLYKSATQHPFLLAGAEGRLPKDILSRWLANDRLYIHSYIRAAGQLLASIDLPKAVAGSQDAFETQLVDWIAEALVAIRREERFFIDVAERYQLGIEFGLPYLPSEGAAAAATSSSEAQKQEKLPGLVQLESIFATVGAVPPQASSPASSSPSSHIPGVAAVQALFSSAAAPTTTAPPPLPWLEGALTFWGTERCYLDAWSWARHQAAERGQGRSHTEDADGGALRKEFIPNWSSPEFERFVERLGRLIDQAVVGVLESKAEGEEREKVKAGILGRLEGKWKTLLEAERVFWPEV